MNHLCHVRYTCPGADPPIGNFSSEAPDSLNFDAFGFPIFDSNTPLPPGGPGTPGLPVPPWLFYGCNQYCSGQINPVYAALCAELQAYLCGVPPGQPVFYNAATHCSITCPDGSIFTWNVPAGIFGGPDQISVDQQASAFACQQAGFHVICLSDIPAGICRGSLYGGLVTSIARGRSPFTFNIVSGSLPQGLSLSQFNDTSALISGNPVNTGNSVFVVQLTDADGNFMQRQYTIAVLDITNANSLPPFGTGSPYSTQLQGAGGVAPYRFAVVGGALPAGLTLASDGTISGTPTATASSTFTVDIVDSNNAGCLRTITLNISSCATVFGNPPWWTNFTVSPMPPGCSGTSSFNGPNFSVSVVSTLGASQQNNIGFGTNPLLGPNIPYNLGVALNCTLTLNTTKSGIVNSFVQLIATLQDSSNVYLINQAPIAAGVQVIPFTIPANCASLGLDIAVAAGNSIAPGSMSVSGFFGS